MAKPKSPSDFCDVAKAKWREVSAPNYWGRELVVADWDLVAEYCRLFARKAKADGKILEHGELVASPNGFPVQSPWLQVVNKCRTDMHKIGLTLRGTSKVAAVEKGKKETRQENAETVAGGRFAPRHGPRLAVDNG